ncbi:uncharacterized protein LOC132721984 isoform X1 [Ruditapes philippinarum]|uniref:uncharacterized protein LOC132721984 isoform X1 n=1 Tax=Ruditapes philippinarum TaxID=129788 RepID=UPI00295BF233|nr:uncharacterized protein LOC132721984 isoform X1 [Ruditapes philippinarum]
MPPPRKSSPRRRDRRSRSRSHSPRRRRSRSRSRDRRRSKSPQRRRSPERKYRSPPRRKSPSPRKRSRSPKRRSRSPKRKSRSHSPRRRSRSQSPRRKGHSPRRSPSPGERIHPVKRPADSSGKRSGFRSRTPSPSPVKRSREERLYEDEVVYQQSQRSSKQARSPVHESTYSGKMYADQPSSSKKPLFPSGSSKRSAEIDFVTIVEKGPKREKLNKRFETHDQVAHGGFDFEENITIGIHRGPQHIELNDDDDIEVNYDFNPKTFRMLFPKKESYVKAIFDRDEIKAFHHDDILDEEAYVEKRTISIKPVDKPKSRKYNEELDYKITVGSSREGYGDRRMVQDSGSRPRSSRSSAYDDVPVTVRLDPKPDPRYEKMYRDQQRYEDLSLMQEKVHRNPNDLRYNLMRRKSDGDRDGGRDGRERQSGQSSMMDARSRIEARRQEGDHYDRRDRRTSHDSPPRRIERKKATVKTDLPDFKNRPGVKLEKPIVWVIGSSVVKDLKQFGDIFPDYDIQTLLKEDVLSLITHGEMDMKIEDILPAVKYLLKNNERPQMIVFQCGELNVNIGRNVDVTEVMKKDLAAVKELIPGVVLVWSQILPPWMIKDTSGSTLSKSRRRINTFMMNCFLSEEVGGCFLYHNMLRTDLKTKYHLPTSDGFLHLRKEGMQAYIYELKTGITYLMTGQGCIFPYIKWPLSFGEIYEFDPQHMCMLNVEQIQSLNAKKLQRFSKKQIEMLSNEQILMFHRNQLSFVYREDFVGKLSPKQLSGLSKTNFLFLTSSQMRLFTEVEERVMWMSEEVVSFVKKRIKARKGDANKMTEPDKEESKKDEEKKERTLGDLIGSSGSDDDDDWLSVYSGGDDDDNDNSSVNSENEWLVDSRIMAPMEGRSHWRSRGRRGSRSFRGRSRGRGRGRGRGWNRPYRGGSYRQNRYSRGGELERGGLKYREERRRSRSLSSDRLEESRYRSRYRSNSRERSRSRHRYRSDSREGHRRSYSRERLERSRSRERFTKSRSRERHGFDRRDRRSREGYRRSVSSDRHRGRSRSSDRYRGRSRSSERSRSHQRPAQASPYPGPFPPRPPGMMLPYGMPPGSYPSMPFPHMPLPGPFPPGAWPGLPMPAGAPVAYPQVAQAAASPQPQVKNWGEGPPANVSSVNTSNLKQIN